MTIIGIFYVARSEAAMEMKKEKEKAVTDERILVMVPPHPFIKHWSSVLRNEQTLSTIFENALPKFGGLLIYEASREWLERESSMVFSADSMESCDAEFLDGLTTSRGELNLRTRSINNDRFPHVLPRKP